MFTSIDINSPININNFFSCIILMEILEKIQNKIMDDNTKVKKYFYTKANNHYIIHIYNPKSEEIVLDSKNTKFYEELINMLFNKEENGCFNHEHDDTSNLYKLDLQGLVNNFVRT